MLNKVLCTRLTKCEYYSHFRLKWFQPNSWELCFWAELWKYAKKNPQILRAPSIRHQGVCIKGSGECAIALFSTFFAFCHHFYWSSQNHDIFSIYTFAKFIKSSEKCVCTTLNCSICTFFFKSLKHWDLDSARNPTGNRNTGLFQCLGRHTITFSANLHFCMYACMYIGWSWTIHNFVRKIVSNLRYLG